MYILMCHFTMNSRSMHGNSLQTRNSTRLRVQESGKVQSISIIQSNSEPKPHILRNAFHLLGEVYNEYAHESSIHGIKYTGRTRSFPERVFWLLIIIFSVIAAGVLAEKFYYRHKQANMRTIVLSHQYPGWKTPLPAITICHSTIASRETLKKYTKGVKKIEIPFGMEWSQFLRDLQFLQEVLFPTNHFEAAMSRLNLVSSANNITLYELFKIVSPACDDYIVLCRWEGKTSPCDSLIKTSLTPYGLCCSVNYAQVNEKRRWTQQEQYYSPRFGRNTIFSVILKDYGPEDRISGLTYGDGARVFIHDRFSYPGPSAHEFIAGQGREVIAYLHGKRLKASDEVMNLPQHERNCRDPQQSPTEIYRVDNCIAKCQEEMFRSYCNCVPFYASILKDNDTPCNFTHVACLARIKLRVLQTAVREYPCHCLPDCYGTNYVLALDITPMNAVQFNPSKFYRVAEEYPNATVIHVTFTRQTSMLLRRDLVLSWINLVASLGGVFNLFLGCSFISAVEIIYFIIYYISRVIKSRAVNLQRT